MKMSVLVKLNESNGELLRDLERLEPRERAERVRVLAMIGLVAVGSRSDRGSGTELGPFPGTAAGKTQEALLHGSPLLRTTFSSAAAKLASDEPELPP